MIDSGVDTDRSDVSNAIADGLEDELNAVARAGFTKSQAEVAVAFGDLKESGEQFQRGTRAGFGYTADHAPFVERGTRPHWPPIDPLKEWAGLVLGDETAAYAVQRKIAEEGTDPQPFVEPGYRVAVRELRRRDISATIDAQL